VSPTRELALQIHAVLLSLLAFHAPSAEMLPCLKEEEKRPATTIPVAIPQLLVGGTTTTATDLSFFMRHSPNVLVGTPGRLVELLASPHVHCPQSSFEMLVLDEADRLLDLGFKPELQRILSYLPKQRRSGLFSASVSEAVGEIIRVGLRNPVKIAVKVKSLRDGGVIEDRKTPASLQMTYLITPASHKLPALAKLLDRLSPRPQKSIVFFSTCAAVDYFQHILPAILPPEFSVASLHGKHQPNVRERNFSRFLASVSPTVLLTTDVAARGLDIPQVDLVVQVDPPSDPKVFIHRNGRAGRAGRRGLAVILLHPGREEDYVPFLEIRKSPIAPLAKPHIEISGVDTILAQEKMRALVREDRGLHDKAQKAFVSWVRSYSKHQATSIFRIGDLDWKDLGNAWGLLRLPKMPEAKHWQGDTYLGQDVDWDNYKYKDKAREKARREALEAEVSGEAAVTRDQVKKKRKNNESWSGKHEKEGLRDARRDKRQRKKKADIVSKMSDAEKAKQMELDELIQEVRRQNLAKAAKKPADEFEGFDD
jgi:ATP-dependent RNA helicase DDX55/SPB4